MEKSIILLCLLAGACTHSTPCALRVASYNIRQDTPQDSLNAWMYRREAIKSLIRYHDFDIIGTQEGFSHQLQDLCRMPEYACFGAGRDDGKSAGEHSAILYKKAAFHLLDSGNFWLSETPDRPSFGWDATRYKRICSWAKFEHKNTGVRFYVFCTHFDHRGLIAQQESAKLMLRKIKELANEEPVICMGDLNSKPATAQISTMTSSLYNTRDISKMPPYGPEETANTAFSIPIDKCIDYIFVSAHFSVAKHAVLTDLRTACLFPSDHLPVVADIILQKTN
ncbi:MAG: endonuclease/exonuclease/phosphatase family protein [Prevotellaceae bacterium]|jgi:endonuclease/exonuclease/phosphatase family metal-dependent hydrolase|nr:endonuclease/exonuclease/phosphatase family protein [Prevotellaceae bacterium]